MRIVTPLGILAAVAALFLQGCGSNSATGAFSASKPSLVIGALVTGIASTAGTLGSSARGANRTALSAADCDSHGEPAVNNTPSDVDYPGKMAYCKLYTNDFSPETVQGPFSSVKSIMCMIEAAGVTYDGVSRSVTVTLDNTCFTTAQLASMSVTAGTTGTATVTGTAPASFNSYFDNGVTMVFTVGSESGTYQIGTKVSATKIEFAALETGSATSHTTYAGSLDFSTGNIGVESRMERIDCVTPSSCGWNRHVRLLGNLIMSGSVATGLTSITGVNTLSFGYSNIQAPPGQAGYGGVVVTASGDAAGIKPRAFPTTMIAAQSDYDVIGNWTETVNNRCLTATSTTAGVCGAGIPLFTTNTAFVLHGGSYTTAANYFATFAGFSSTSVNLNTDIP